MSTVDVAVVGAGPYGLSVAAHLQDTKRSLRVFGTPMDSWRNRMPDQMLLRSEGFASSLSDPEDELTLERYCKEHDIDARMWASPIPIDVFRDYGDWFIQRREIPVEDVQVQRLSQSNGDLALDLATGEQVRARRVVLAVGITHFEFVPPVLEGLAPELLSHASRPERFESLRGRKVTVIGAGQSAIESAAILHELGADTRLVGRTPSLSWTPDPHPFRRPLPERLRAPIAGLCTGWKFLIYSKAPDAIYRFPSAKRLSIARNSFGPAGAWWLKARVPGKVPMDLGRAVVGATANNGGVRIELRAPDGTPETIDTDHIVAGTGYHPDVARVPFIDESLRGRIDTLGGYPVLSSGFESTVPNLHFVGMAATATFGPLMRFVYGARFAARRVAHRIG